MAFFFGASTVKVISALKRPVSLDIVGKLEKIRQSCCKAVFECSSDLCLVYFYEQCWKRNKVIWKNDTGGSNIIFT